MSLLAIADSLLPSASLGILTKIQAHRNLDNLPVITTKLLAARLRRSQFN